MAATPAKKRPVLIVAEDDPDILHNLVEYFESLDFIVYGVLSGELAYEMAQRVSPDLIISDLIMPGLCGLSLLQRLAEFEKTRGVPFLILSARVDSDLRERARQFGAVDFVTKPFSLATLKGAVESALSMPKAQEPAPR